MLSKRTDWRGVIPLPLILIFVFIANCGPNKRANLELTVKRVDQVKLMAEAFFKEYYPYQVGKITRQIEAQEITESEAWEEKAKLDEDAQKVRDGLKAIQALQISLANTVDLYGDLSNPKAEEKVNETLKQLMFLTSQVCEIIEQMKAGE